MNYIFSMFAHCVCNPTELRMIVETDHDEEYYMIDFCEEFNQHSNYGGDNDSVVAICPSMLVGVPTESFASYEDGWNALKALIENCVVTDVYVETY